MCVCPLGHANNDKAEYEFALSTKRSLSGPRRITFSNVFACATRGKTKKMFRDCCKNEMLFLRKSKTKLTFVCLACAPCAYGVWDGLGEMMSLKNSQSLLVKCIRVDWSRITCATSFT